MRLTLRLKSEGKVTECEECGKKLSLFQLLANSEFCSEAHRQLRESKYMDAMLGRLQRSA